MRLTTPRSSRQDAPGAIDDLYQVPRPEITLHLHQLVEGLHTLVQAAGALAASGHSVRGYDGEPSSTPSPKLVHCRVRLAPRRSRGSRRIAGVWFALVVRLDQSGRTPALLGGSHPHTLDLAHGDAARQGRADGPLCRIDAEWRIFVCGSEKMRHRGLPKVNWQFTLAMAAYDLVRLPKLLAQPVA